MKHGLSLKHMPANVLVLVTAAAIVMGGVRYGLSQSDQNPKRAVVFIHPKDKQKITGYLPIAYAWGQELDPPRDLARGLINLKDAMKKWTKVDTQLEEHLQLGSDKLMEMPFVFVTSKRAFQLTEVEKENIRNYIARGGFLFVENAEPREENSPGAASLKQMLMDVIPNARFAAIPNGHQIYHSFFDFNDGPPTGAEIGIQKLAERRPVMSKQVLYLEGIWYRNRLVAVYSDKGYVVKWAEGMDNTPQLRMGINLIVFALTQEGGIAEKI